MELRKSLAIASATLATGGALAEMPTAAQEAYGAQPVATAADTAPQNVLVIQSADISASDIATKHVTILADEHISEKNVNTATCRWFKTFMNSGEDANGRKFWFVDHNGKLCRDSASPSGWVKEAGGMTGRNCGNEAKPGQSTPTVKGKVLMVPRFNMMVTLKASSTANAAELCGSASAVATATQKMNLGLFLRTNSAGKAKIEAKLDDKLTTSAHSHVTCTTSTPPPTPPTPPHNTPTHGCEVSNILEKDGRTDNLTVVTDGGNDSPTLETVDWGDGQTSSYTNTAPTQEEVHFYNNDATYTETVTENFGDGGTATCTGTVTTLQESQPLPPA